MAYHDDLLQQAIDLANKNPAAPTQADLRRSVSAAYYLAFDSDGEDCAGLFSLLTNQAS